MNVACDNSTCNVASCNAIKSNAIQSNRFRRGMCNKHYLMWRKTGDPEGSLRLTVEQRLWANVDVGHPLGCWLWTGFANDGGYGVISVKRSGRYTHRVAFEALRDAIPAGLQLDHLCRNRLCCNPDHLEPVTPRENFRRSESSSMRASRRNRCLRGHDLNRHGYVRLNGKGRVCKRCARIRERRDRMDAIADPADPLRGAVA